MNTYSPSTQTNTEQAPTQQNPPHFQVQPDDIPVSQQPALRGNIQEVLAENLGIFVDVDFLIGTGTLVTKQGILYSVGISFLVLYDPNNGTYTLCDLYAVKFVTFYNPDETDVPSLPPPEPRA